MLKIAVAEIVEQEISPPPLESLQFFFEICRKIAPIAWISSPFHEIEIDGVI